MGGYIYAHGYAIKVKFVALVWGMKDVHKTQQKLMSQRKKIVKH